MDRIDVPPLLANFTLFPTFTVLEQQSPVAVAGGRGGISPATFMLFALLGFGATLAVIVGVVLLWWFTRRRRLARLALQQVDSQLTLAPTKKPKVPVLVVHPGGDAVVAFKEKDLEKGVEEEGEAAEGGKDTIMAVRSPAQSPAQRLPSLPRRPSEALAAPGAVRVVVLAPAHTADMGAGSVSPSRPSARTASARL